MQIALNPEHLNKLKSITETTTWVASRNPRSWAIAVGAPPEIAAALRDEKVDRDYLKGVCADPAFSPEQCFLAIMAWGGMKINHGSLAWKARKDWLSIVIDLRAGVLSRGKAYERFKQFRKESPRCGMGPAYYTKLIFFASPSHDGYIMDQWTALSVNLITDLRKSPIVQMTTGHFRGRRWDRVADTNDALTYEAFCLTIERMGAEMEMSPEAVEERLFSQGGRKPGQWRTYVKANRPNYRSTRA